MPEGLARSRGPGGTNTWLLKRHRAGNQGSVLLQMKSFNGPATSLFLSTSGRISEWPRPCRAFPPTFGQLNPGRGGPGFTGRCAVHSSSLFQPDAEPGWPPDSNRCLIRPCVRGQISPKHINLHHYFTGFKWRQQLIRNMWGSASPSNRHCCHIKRVIKAIIFTCLSLYKWIRIMPLSQKTFRCHLGLIKLQDTWRGGQKHVHFLLQMF